MSTPYERAKGGRLTFKGGTLATRSKSIDKKHKKKNAKPTLPSDDGVVVPGDSIEGVPYDEALAIAGADEDGGEGGQGDGGGGDRDLYTIDAAKKMKYEELFPVEARKFGYDPKFKAKSVEDALDDRVKKKADRYCK
ncbi:hypothetical protein MLD38_031629 [Melastoma candidum]|uniref:Uncharacterized protein n=1 Tax=Melastoma candidum TaxID=119954 RepID=A0ACB9MQ99_9MYRT|nr:hypothetical protein MLD38_031629 [Melastoma candidum]